MDVGIGNGTLMVALDLGSERIGENEKAGKLTPAKSTDALALTEH
ncbi:MAG: hypothetical protein ACI87E_002089 [Mariniblastus sp.]